MGKPWPPGMVAAAKIGAHLGVTPASAQQEIASLLQSYGLPTAISASEQDYRDTLVKDKKSQGATSTSSPSRKSAMPSP